jgi:hypothetical protein
MASGRYWLDRVETQMRRAPIKVREMAEQMITDECNTEQTHELV